MVALRSAMREPACGKRGGARSRGWAGIGGGLGHQHPSTPAGGANDTTSVHNYRRLMAGAQDVQRAGQQGS